MKKDGWFIPHPGVAIGNQKHILLDVTPVSTTDVADDPFVQAAGMLKNAPIDGVVFQKKVRKEWDGR